MKIVLLVLSGHEQRALDWLQERYPGAIIQNISRERLDHGNWLPRLRVLRALHPDMFAIVTERLVWQRGQNALLAFGVAAGARRVVMIDSYGAVREETRSGILAGMPGRLVREFAASTVAVAHSERKLEKFEKEVANRSEAEIVSNRDSIRIAYLRSTPSPGSHAGGAATHITGFVNAAIGLGTRVNVISNDYIAGLDASRLMLVDPQPIGSTRAAFDLRNNLIFSAGVMLALDMSPADLIYQRYGRFTWAGVAASLRTRAPLFLEYNGSEVWIGKHWDMSGMIPLLERFERLNLQAATRIFVVSEVERQNLLRAGIADEKIIVNPNGVDTEAFQPGAGGEAARRELGISANELVAGFVGTFGPWHGVLTLAEAIVLRRPLTIV